MLQYKLYKFYDEDKEKTIEKLYKIFGEKNIIIFAENILGIYYNYSNRGYRYVLKKVMDLNISQFIVTSNIYFRLIDFCIKNQIFIQKINFVDSIEEEHNEFVKNYLIKINKLKDIKEKEKLKETLFDELNWITSDECIDIKLTSFTVESTESPIKIGIELHHNGVLFLDNKKALNKLKKIISEVI